MENDWINSKDKITLALPPNATPINCDFSYYLGSNANSVRGDLDNARSILMVNLEDQDTKANQQLKRQRWKSIHDEKIMIANLNQNLLPGVLKQNISDDYSNTLTGLENIPSSTNLTTAIVRKLTAHQQISPKSIWKNSIICNIYLVTILSMEAQFD